MIPSVALSKKLDGMWTNELKRKKYPLKKGQFNNCCEFTKEYVTLDRYNKQFINKL